MCCKTKTKRIWQPPLNRMTGFPVKFDYEQLEQLRRKFKKMANFQNDIDMLSFERNMGIMGLQSMVGFSQRMFNSFDMDQDGKISFMDYTQYMEIIKCGSQKNKALISFRLIDLKKKNSVNIQDFRNFLNHYFQSWGSLTNAILSDDLRKQTDRYVSELFKEIRLKNHRDDFDANFYAEHMYGKKQFMNGFSFILEGASSMQIQNDENGRGNFSHYKTLTKLQVLYNTNFSENSHSQPHKQETTDEKNEPFSHLFRKQKQDNHQKNQTSSREKELSLKLQTLQKELKHILDGSAEQYEKMKEKYQKREKQSIIDIGSIIMNIPKEHPKNSTTEGKMILFGDQKWNLVLNMMIGIQMAIGSVRGYQEMFQEQPEDFDLKYTFQLIPRRFGSEKHTPKICHFTDYAPNTFNQIRKIFKIDNSAYINSIGPSKLMKSLMMGEISSLTSLTSQGKSGSFFYYTTDGNYMLKTIQHREYKLLRKILKDYFFYLKENPNSLLIKFYGLHRLEFSSSLNTDDQTGKIYFVIMGNVFNAKERIIERYDLKGSTYGRKNSNENPEATLKDLNFIERMPNGIELHPENREQIINILRKDSNFLRDNDIIDYSVLLGRCKRHLNLLESFISKSLPKEKKQINLSNCESLNGEQKYIIGVIDILIEYDSRKVMEYHFKKVVFGEGISAVPPKDYAERFMNFMENRVFPVSNSEIKQ